MGAHGVRTLVVCPHVTDTGMFNGAFTGGRQPLLQRFLFRIFPPRTATDVALETICAAERGEKFIVVPRIMHWAPTLFRCLPVDLLLYVLSQSGGSTGMDNFVGKAGAGAGAAVKEE